ncbi:MAG: hypothetical protein MIO93_16915, partial [ANME-2 cluster archaeon]|nr:hypothetical protein [ANME-2 cluster archaeon]
LKYNGHYQEMLDVFQERFGDIPQIGASVDVMIFPNEMRTDGATLVLCKDNDARIEVKSANENGATKSAEKLAKQIKCEKGVVILNFPLVHVPDAMKSAEFYARGKYFSFRANRGDEKTKREMAGKFSDYCDKSKIFYLPSTILEIFAKQLDYKVPVVGMNVMHTQVKFNSPSIFSNFKDIGDGIAALVIEKDDVEVVYDDIFPDKGTTIEETMEIFKSKFKVVKEFDALFEKNVLISLDNMPPIKAVKDAIGATEKNEFELKDYLSKGGVQVTVPYFIVFFNKKTSGCVFTGIDSYFPFDLFPFSIDVKDFSDTVFLAQEFMYINMNDYISGLYLLNENSNFKLFCVDGGSISAFGNKVIEFKNEIEKIQHENYFGVLTAPSSVFLPKKFKRRENIAEIKNNIFYTNGGTNTFVSF